MDAREFFQLIVEPNYYEFYRAQNSIRLLWNAIVSMNTAPEFLVLDRQKYRLDLLREEIEREAQKIREELGLIELQYCANTFKHVRKIPSGSRQLCEAQQSCPEVEASAVVVRTIAQNASDSEC